MRSQLRRMFCHIALVCAGVMAVASSSTLAAAAAAAQAVGSASIAGVVLKADNSPIPYAAVRLRNVVTGKIVAAAVADDQGRFMFSNLESGSYMVELVSDKGKPLAISRTATVGPGETVATVVRTGTKVPWFLGFFANAAAAVSAAAASAGVTAVAPSEIRPVSPEK